MTRAVVEPVTDGFRFRSQPREAGTRNPTFRAQRPFPGLRPLRFARPEHPSSAAERVAAVARSPRSRRKARAVAVIRKSPGSGKSSLILAGLRGLLAEEAAENGTAWVLPRNAETGHCLLSRLAKALRRPFGERAAAVRTH